jgi:hypothetical protein
VHLFDLNQYSPILFTTLGLLPLTPAVISTAAGLKSSTPTGYFKLIVMGSHERVLHPSSLVKYAAAFFRMSRSSLTCSRGRERGQILREGEGRERGQRRERGQEGEGSNLYL